MDTDLADPQDALKNNWISSLRMLFLGTKLNVVCETCNYYLIRVLWKTENCHNFWMIKLRIWGMYTKFHSKNVKLFIRPKQDKWKARKKWIKKLESFFFIFGKKSLKPNAGLKKKNNKIKIIVVSTLNWISLNTDSTFGLILCEIFSNLITKAEQRI